MSINKEKAAIIAHTIRSGPYCGGSKDMDELCEAGFMVCVGTKSFVPDPYYQVTADGKVALRGYEAHRAAIKKAGEHRNPRAGND